MHFNTLLALEDTRDLIGNEFGQKFSLKFIFLQTKKPL